MAAPSPADPAALPWAKSDRDTDSSLLLWRHMADSATVAGLLWDEWLPRGIIQRLSVDLDMQVPELCEGMRSAGFYFRTLANERVRAPRSCRGNPYPMGTGAD